MKTTTKKKTEKKKTEAKPRSGGKVEIAGILAAMPGLGVPIGQLHPDPENARRHDERGNAAIMASLERFGQQAPVVYTIREGKKIVIKGNGVLAAATALGWKELAAVESGLAAREAVAFAIADNRTTDLSDFDEKLLAAQLAELAVDEDDLASLGFTAEEIAEFSAPVPADAADEKPDHQEELAELERKYLSHPPAFTWVLIGIATVKYHEINDAVERINAVSGVIVKTGVSDEPK